MYMYMPYLIGSFVRFACPHTNTVRSSQCVTKLMMPSLFTISRATANRSVRHMLDFFRVGNTFTLLNLMLPAS